MLTNSIVLASNEHDTFLTPSIPSLGPLQIVYVTQNTINGCSPGMEHLIAIDNTLFECPGLDHILI